MMPTNPTDPPVPSGEQHGEQIVAPSLPVLQGIQKPTGFDLSAKTKVVNWKIDKQQWENYSTVVQLEKQPEEYRVVLFFYSFGPKAVQIYRFDLSEANWQKLSKILKEFDNFAIGETNETYERYNFNSCDQK